MVAAWSDILLTFLFCKQVCFVYVACRLLEGITYSYLALYLVDNFQYPKVLYTLERSSLSRTQSVQVDASTPFNLGMGRAKEGSGWINDLSIRCFIVQSIDNYPTVAIYHVLFSTGGYCLFSPDAIHQRCHWNCLGKKAQHVNWGKGTLLSSLNLSSTNKLEMTGQIWPKLSHHSLLRLLVSSGHIWYSRFSRLEEQFGFTPLTNRQETSRTRPQSS